MTREEAIKYLRRFYMKAVITDEYGEMDDIESYEVAVDMAIEALEQKHGWIPVSERLPEKFGLCLVTIVPEAGELWKKVEIAGYSDLMGIAKPCFWGGNVGKNDFENVTKGVTAWMPLPEPWEGVKNETD